MPLTNNGKKGYRPLPLCDSHMHLSFNMPISDTLCMLETYMAYFGCARVALLALPHSSRAACDDPSNNLKALWCKLRLNEGAPRAYAFGGLYHYFDERDTAAGFVAQLEALRALGFDGLKVLLGKPPLRKRLGRPLDDDIFDGVWRLCEETRFPVTMHLGDPAPFWQPGADGAPAHYDASFPTLERLRAEVDGILRKFPALDLTLCHFYFMAGDLERADRFLDEHPTVSFDLTPGSEMYYHFSQRSDEWRDFFTRHRKRLFFGTDSDNWACPPPEGCELNFSYPFNLVRNCLEAKGPFRFEDFDYGLLTPLAPEDGVVEDICCRNFPRRCGEPKEIDRDLMRRAVEAMIALYERNAIPAGDDARRSVDLGSLHVIENSLRAT